MREGRAESLWGILGRLRCVSYDKLMAEIEMVDEMLLLQRYDQCKELAET